MKPKHNEDCTCSECANRLAKETELPYNKVKKLLKQFNKGQGGLLKPKNAHDGVRMYAKLQKVVK